MSEVRQTNPGDRKAGVAIERLEIRKGSYYGISRTARNPAKPYRPRPAYLGCLDTLRKKFMQIRTDPPVSLETLQTASAALSAAAKDPATARAASREACLERIADRRLAISAWRRSWAVVAFIGTLRPGAAGFIPGLAEFSALEGSEASVSARSSIDIGSLFLAAATCKLTIAGRLGRDFHRRLAEIRPALKDKFFTPDPE